MFRKMRRARQEVSPEECVRILKTEKRGVLSVLGDDGYPYGVPVNFYFEESEGRLYIHGAKEGHKLDAIRRCSKVCFTTWDAGYKAEGDWAWHVTSVIAQGRAACMDDPAAAREKLRKLGLKYYPTAQEVEQEMQSSADRVQMLEVQIEHLTGKLVHEK